MDINACYHLGQVFKSHGTKGEIQLFLDVDNPGNYKKLESVFLEINQKLVPFFISSIQISKNTAIVKFDDVDTIEQAEGLVSSDVYLPLELLPPLKEGQFYYHEIIGYQVKDKKLGILGKIEDVVSLPQHEIFTFVYQDKEILAPLNDRVVLQIDRVNQIVEVDLPDGLLDVYLNP